MRWKIDLQNSYSMGVMQKLLYSLLFGYYKVVIETRGLNRALQVAKLLTCLLVGLILLNLFFWLLPSHLKDSFVPYSLAYIASPILVYTTTADTAGVQVAITKLNKMPLLAKVLVSISSFSAIPGFYALLMHQIFH
jgi:hypothetical protein